MRLRLTARRSSACSSRVPLDRVRQPSKMTDSPRAASEMLLVSQAVDYAVAKIDFRTPLSGQTAFLDTTSLDGSVVDKGYLISTVRQQLSIRRATPGRSHACSLRRRTAGRGPSAPGPAIACDASGTPAVTLLSVVRRGFPVTSIPEIAVAKKSEQRGVAKVAVFAYNRSPGVRCSDREWWKRTAS